MRKEPDWLGNSTNTGTSRSGAPKVPRTPKKKVAKKGVSDEDNEDDDEPEISPAKFTPKHSLNKTKDGRITKTSTPRKAATAVPTYVESGDEIEDEDDAGDEYVEETVSTIAVKSEINSYNAVSPNYTSTQQAGNSFAHSFDSGLSNGNSNGHSNGYDIEQEDVFHEAPGHQYENAYDDDAV